MVIETQRYGQLVMNRLPLARSKQTVWFHLRAGQNLTSSLFTKNTGFWIFQGPERTAPVRSTVEPTWEQNGKNYFLWHVRDTAQKINNLVCSFWKQPTQERVKMRHNDTSVWTEACVIFTLSCHFYNCCHYLGLTTDIRAQALAAGYTFESLWCFFLIVASVYTLSSASHFL